jgi:hypothetical protein
MRPKQEQYNRLTALTQPEAAPTKRVGTEAPIGAATGGPSAGKSAAEFTKAQQSSPGSVFKRQLAGADISGITRLTEQPLLREAGQEALRVAGEGTEYKRRQSEERKNLPQFQDFSTETIGKITGGGTPEDFETARKVLTQQAPETPDLAIGDVKEFTPLQALRGGSVESLLRKEATGPYTTGMAGLDALLFAKKGGAQALAAKGIALRTAEQATADALEKAATAEERQKMQDLVASQRAGLFGGLESAQKTQFADFQARLKAETEARDAQNLRAQKISEETARQKALEDLTMNRQIPQGERDAIFAAIQQADISKQLAPMFAGGQASLADIATPEEEARYANLLQLLGIGGVEAPTLRGMELGKETAGVFTPRAAIQPQEFYEGERANIDLINALREAGLSAAAAYRAANPAAYTPAIEPAPSGRLPSDRDDLGQPRTRGGASTEADYEYDPRGRYA